MTHRTLGFDLSAPGVPDNEVVDILADWLSRMEDQLTGGARYLMMGMVRVPNPPQLPYQFVSRINWIPRKISLAVGEDPSFLSATHTPQPGRPPVTTLVMRDAPNLVFSATLDVATMFFEVNSQSVAVIGLSAGISDKCFVWVKPSALPGTQQIERIEI